MPRITFNSINIDIKIGANSLKRIPRAVFTQNISGAGNIEQINEYQIEAYSFDSYYSIDEWRKLYTFFYGWALLGKTWSFAMDKDKTVNTTLDGAANASQKVVPLTSTTGIKAGDTLILIPAAGQYREAIKVAKINAGESITAVDNLIFSHTSGDVCRHDEYFPSVKNTAKEYNWIQEGDEFSSTFEFIENKL